MRRDSVFQVGEYEDDLPLNSGWTDGDWNGDRDFTTTDILLAFQVGAYETQTVSVNIQSTRALSLGKVATHLVAFQRHRTNLGRRNRTSSHGADPPSR